jgi:hypothetical protein
MALTVITVRRGERGDAVDSAVCKYVGDRNVHTSLFANKMREFAKEEGITTEQKKV